ncbi:MAG TPA: TonB-dependent receptor [Segetibacter sp.]
MKCMAKSSLQRLTIAVCFTLIAVFQAIGQAKTVTGRVTNVTGEPLAGASISVVGSAGGTSAGADGSFTISAPANGSIRVSAVGFSEQTLNVANQSTLNVKLQPSAATQLEQVVVVGYGTQRKRDVTGAVVSVSGETLREVPAPNVIAQLRGRTAGVSVVQNASTPGASGQIRIRGNRTITASSGQSDALDAPLLVVDGVAFGGSINDISPEDIASLDILKDASATAIYGSRGAGGVILITTKRGRTGKAIMSYDSYYGITNVMGKYNLYNGAEYAQLKADAATYNRTTGAGTTAYPLTPAEQAALAAGISTDWQDLIYQQGYQTNHQLGFNGGSETTQYGLSMGYFNETGIIPNQRFERYSLRTNIDHRINRILKIGLSTLNTLSYSNTAGGGGVPYFLVRTTPLAAPYNADGTVNIRPAVGSIDDPNVVSPLTLETGADAILAKNRRFRTFNSLYGEVQLAKGLRYRLNVGLDFRQDNDNNYNGPNTFTNPSAATQSQSNASVNNTEAWTYQISNLLYYDKTFAEKHRLGFTGLFEVTKDHFQSSGFNAIGVYADYMRSSNLANAASVTGVPGNFFESGLVSYMARANYGYENRYNITATVRVDGSSTLSPGQQYFTYPAIAAGWNISNEKFMSNVPFLSNLRLRGGWGISGNRNVSPYATLGLLNSSTYNFGQGTAGQQPAFLVTNLPNPNLSWQSTSQTNIGVDFGLLRNRITGAIEVYEQKTKDILLTVNLPQSNGANSTLKNLGKTRGRGVEITLSSTNVQRKTGFTWNTDLNFSVNREEITQLTTPTEKANIGNGWFVGHPLTVIYDVKKTGIWQTEDSAKGLLSAQTSPLQYPGQISIEDLNSDGKIDANDRQILGNFQPSWEGGITNRFTYKGFDLAIVIFARMGMKVLVPYLTANGTAQGYPFFNQGRFNQIETNYWTRNNPTNDFPAPDAGTDRLWFGSTLGYRDGSFVKCRSINLGYQLPSSLLGRVGISSVRIYLNATNPFILYSPFVREKLALDPEGNGYGGAVSASGGGEASVPERQISVNLNNPPSRQYTLGVNVRF